MTADKTYINMCRFNKILILFFSIALIAGCKSPTEEQDPQIKSFYEKLHHHLQSRHFSPLEFANPRSLHESSFTWEETNGSVFISQENRSTQLLLNPIRLSYETGSSKSALTYSVQIFMADGTMKEIREIKSPKKIANSIVFSTDIPGARLILTPVNGCFQWQVKADFSSDIDTIALITSADGPFYGGGERFLSTCLNGRTISNQPNDHYFLLRDGKLSDPDLKAYEPSYLPIPFIMNPNGQGWYFDGAASMFLSIDPDGKFFKTTIADSKIIFYTFQEASPKEVLRGYTQLVGHQPELPDWAFGVWINVLEGQDSVLVKVNRLKQQGVPVTAVWLFDMDDPNTSTGWPYWSKGIYPDYRMLTDSIHSLGFKVLTYLRPFSYKDLLYYRFDNPFYGLFDSLGVILHAKPELPSPRYSTFIPQGQYDFYNPVMGALWKKMLSMLLLDDNFDGWMEDFGDIAYSYDTEKNVWQPLDFGLDYPISDNEYANACPLIYHKLSYELTSEIKPDIATFCRSGSAGSAPYTRIVWGGDQLANWDKRIGYPSAVTAGITCGLSGYGNWAPDILCDSPSRELWKRWVQFAAFTPLMRDHLWDNDRTSIDIWTDSESFRYFKKYALIHAGLVPYIREAAKQYRETGTPVIRHMMLEFPDDRETYFCKYQYMLGDKYLVAPVIEEGASVTKVYFPQGKWKNFWDGTTIHSKGEWMQVAAPIDIIPVFEKL